MHSSKRWSQLPWRALSDTHKLLRSIIGELQHPRFRYIGLYPCSVSLSMGCSWGQVHDARQTFAFAESALLALQLRLAWCFCIPLQELALVVEGHQHQLAVLLDCVRLVASCFFHRFAEVAA